MALRLSLIARRKKDDYIAINSIAFEIAFKRCAMDFDSLSGDGLCVRNHLRNDSLNLSQSRPSQRENHCYCACAKEPCGYHLVVAQLDY
jgi:hypothetical protein